MSISIGYVKKVKIVKMPISIRYGKIAKCLSQLGMEKHINRKMSVSIRYGKNSKIVKFLSPLGMEKIQKIAKFLSQLGMEKK